jgi:site-specific DNA-methyltransferase (adenine-specific)
MRNSVVDVTTAATEEARRWEGWGTALKPAHEPIVVARKPLAGTVAGNVLVWGTGGLNIDGCRVGTPSEVKPQVRPTTDVGGGSWSKGDHVPFHYPADGGGRWPANVVFDRTAGEALDQQSGEASYNPKGVFGKQQDDQRTDTPAAFAVRKAGDGVFGYGDRGGASRFFTQADFGPDDWPFVYQAKPSRRERNAGLDGLPEKVTNDITPPGTKGANSPRAGANRNGAASNHHPTVKPLALMRWLVRLTTPPGGTVLDPFAGSGTTLVAAILEGMVPLGCEMTDEYLPIIEGRMAWAHEQVAARVEAEANPAQPTLL